MARQAKRIAADKQAAQEAEATMETLVQEAKKGRKAKPILCTAEDIVRERDERGLSWAQVARNLDLSSPGAARKAYTDLTGKPHTDSLMKGARAPRGMGVRSQKSWAVKWDDDSDQDEIIERLQGAWIEESGDPGSKSYTPGHWSGSMISVQRKYGIEEVRIGRVVRFTFGPHEDLPLTVEVKSDQGSHRAFYVRDIKEVR